MSGIGGRIANLSSASFMRRRRLGNRTLDVLVLESVVAILYSLGTIDYTAAAKNETR